MAPAPREIAQAEGIWVAGRCHWCRNSGFVRRLDRRRRGSRVGGEPIAVAGCERRLRRRNRRLASGSQQAPSRTSTPQCQSPLSRGTLTRRASVSRRLRGASVRRRRAPVPMSRIPDEGRPIESNTSAFIGYFGGQRRAGPAVRPAERKLLDAGVVADQHRLDVSSTARGRSARPELARLRWSTAFELASRLLAWVLLNDGKQGYPPVAAPSPRSVRSASAGLVTLCAENT